MGVNYFQAMERSIGGSPGYTSPSKKSPGLLLFLVDRSLPSSGSKKILKDALSTVYEQINRIKDRFKTNNKQETFRVVIMEFANAPQRKGTYFVDDFAENINLISYKSSPESPARINGTSLKKVLDEANDCVQEHLRSNVKDSRDNKPPISIIMFSGSVHDSKLDYDYPSTGAPSRNEFYKNSVADYLKPLLNRENILFGVFNFLGNDVKGQRINDASIITKSMIDSALDAEKRYGVLPGKGIKEIWKDPYSLVNQKFIFDANSFVGKLSRFLAAMLKLGTYTSISGDGSGKDDFNQFD